MQFPSLAATAGVALALACPAAVQADDVLDTIDAARTAYEAGNIQQTIDELGHAQQLVREMKTAGLLAFLPEPPEGWTRQVRSDMGAAMALFGGGVGAEATYATGADSFTVTLMADNPMVQAFAGMLGSAGLPVRDTRVDVGTETFLEQEGELIGLIDGRILVQASGAPVETMVPFLATIDFTAMKAFGG